MGNGMKTGIDWILRELKVDPNYGINSSEIESRRKYFGTNLKDEAKPSGMFNISFERKHFWG